MADGSSIIREYALSLGWQIDEPSFRRYAQALKETDNSILAVGATLTATAIASFVFTEKMADSMEKLYFATRRTGSTAAEFQGVALGIQNAGGSAQDAAQSIEALGKILRYDPARTNYLKHLGIDDKGLSDAAVALDELSDRWINLKKEGPRGSMQANQERGVLGIGDSTFDAIMSGQYHDEKKKYEDLQRKFGLDPAANENAHNFEKQLRDLIPYVEVAGQKLESDLNQPMMHFVALVERALKGAVDFADALNKYGFKKVDEGIGTNIANKMMDAGLPKAAVDEIFHPGRALLSADYWSKWGNVLGVTGASANTEAEKAHAILTGKYGWSPIAAAGIIGNGMQESGMGTNPHTNDDPAHQGDFQWDRTRQAEYRHLTGKDLRNATLEEQLWYVNYELTQGKYKGAGAALRGAKDTQDASDIFQNQFEVAPGQDTAHRELYAHRIYNDVGGAQMTASRVIAPHVTINIHGNAKESDVRNGAYDGVVAATRNMSPP